MQGTKAHGLCETRAVAARRRMATAASDRAVTQPPGEAMWWAERTQGAVSLGHAVALNNEPSKMSSACLVVEGMSGSVTPQTTAELSCATSG